MAAVLNGPLLFIIFINEMPGMVNSCIQMFAEDAKLYINIQDDIDVTLLQSDLYQLQEWLKAWQLNFNSEKYKILHLRWMNQHASYHMSMRLRENIELQSTKLKKDLGKWVDPSLIFMSQCKTQVRKANRTLGFIRISYTDIDETSLTKLYMT